GRIAAELQQPRLVGMERQAELREPLAQRNQKALCVITMLKAQDKVIRKPHDDDLAVRLRAAPSLDPEVEPAVQVQVRQQRTNTAALDGPYLTDGSLPVLQHSCVQPFLDEAQDAPVCYPVLDKLHQPSVVQGIEERPDVRVEHPVHLLRQQTDR